MSTHEPEEDTLMEGGLYDEDSDDDNDDDLDNLINGSVHATSNSSTTVISSPTDTNKAKALSKEDANPIKPATVNDNTTKEDDILSPGPPSNPFLDEAAATLREDPVAPSVLPSDTAISPAMSMDPPTSSTQVKSSPETSSSITSPPSSTTSTTTTTTTTEPSPPKPQPKEEPQSLPKPAPKTQSTTTNTNNKPTPPSQTVLEANNEIATLLLSNKITNAESSKLQAILRENAQLKDKITKLKTLLARSSKVSKEQKQDLETHKKLLEMAQEENERLKVRLETLANRPSHMDLLADFDTNFDKALLSMAHKQEQEQQGQGQTGGEKTNSSYFKEEEEQQQQQQQQQQGENVSSMLLTELQQAKSRIEQLEGTNASLMKRSSMLEDDNLKYQQERQSVNLKMSNLQLELRMAKMETENATRAMREKASSLAEMQMEIDLVTKSAISANARAAEGIEVVKSVKSDKARVKELEAKVAALQEWAIASASAKEITLEQNKDLQKKLNAMIEEAANRDATAATEARVDAGAGTGAGAGGVSVNTDNGVLAAELSLSPKNSFSSSIERRLWTKSSSLVVGAGMIMSHIIKLGDCHIARNESVLLRWKFDITPVDLDIIFSILKGQYEDKNAMREADAIMRDRKVVSGGGGEVQGAFVKQNACTLVWSNEHSWVRPRSIKYVVEAFAVM